MPSQISFHIFWKPLKFCISYGIAYLDKSWAKIVSLHHKCWHWTVFCAQSDARSAEYILYGCPNSKYDFRFVISMKSWSQKYHLLDYKVISAKKHLQHSNNLKNFFEYFLVCLSNHWIRDLKIRILLFLEYLNT